MPVLVTQATAKVFSIGGVMRFIVFLLATLGAITSIASVTTGHKRSFYVSKPLTTLLIILIAALPGDSSLGWYGWFIITGLLLSLFGDIFLMLPSDRFKEGLVAFLLAHGCYIAAFLPGIEIRFNPYLLFPIISFGIWIYAQLYRSAGKLRIAVLVYSLAILAMAWLALERLQQIGGPGPLLAASGALFFVASDCVLAWNRFVGKLPAAQILILGTYYVAQLLIAAST
jgi:uncharacterized membrane protein YhhN